MNKKITVILNSNLIEIVGKNKVISSIILVNERDKKVVYVDAVFPCIGLSPNTELVKKLKICNSNSYIKTIDISKTAIPGLFSAGDVVEKSYKQIATAVGDGATAAQSAIYYLNKEYENQKK